MKRTWVPQSVVVAALAWALFPGNPYGYYIFLRWLCFGVFAYLTLHAIVQEKKVWGWVLGLVAIIYNPFIRVHLARETWSAINVATMFVSVGSILVLRVRPASSTPSPQGNERLTPDSPPAPLITPDLPFSPIPPKSSPSKSDQSELVRSHRQDMSDALSHAMEHKRTRLTKELQPLRMLVPTQEMAPLTGTVGVLHVPEDRLDLIYRRINTVLTEVGELPEDFLHVVTQNPHEIRGAFDPNLLMLAFEAVRLRPGYVLDYVWRGDPHGGAPLLYARLDSQMPIETVDAFASKFGVAPEDYAPCFPEAFLPGIEFDDTPLGAAEFVVFLNEASFFYWFWHACYGRMEIVATKAARSNHLGSIDAASREMLQKIPGGAKIWWANEQIHVEMLTFKENVGYMLTTWDLVPPNRVERVTESKIAPSIYRVLY